MIPQHHIRAVVAACDNVGRTFAGIAIRSRLTPSEAVVALGEAHARGLIDASLNGAAVVYRANGSGARKAESR